MGVVIRTTRAKLAGVLSRLPQLLRDRAEELADATKTAEERLPTPTGPRGLPYLTGAEDKVWRTIFATRKPWAAKKFALDERGAARRAAQIAWTAVKKLGGRTKKGLLEAERGRFSARRPGDLARAVAGQVVKVLGKVFGGG